MYRSMPASAIKKSMVRVGRAGPVSSSVTRTQARVSTMPPAGLQPRLDEMTIRSACQTASVGRPLAASEIGDGWPGCCGSGEPVKPATRFALVRFLDFQDRGTYPGGIPADRRVGKATIEPIAGDVDRFRRGRRLSRWLPGLKFVGEVGAGREVGVPGDPVHHVAAEHLRPEHRVKFGADEVRAAAAELATAGNELNDIGRDDDLVGRGPKPELVRDEIRKLRAGRFPTSRSDRPSPSRRC